MMFDKMSLFADGASLAAGANTSKYTRALDLRLNGQIGIDGALKVYGQIVAGTVATADKARVTTVLQTSADGTTWTDVVAETQDDNTLIAMALPVKGLKRFIRLKLAQTTALSKAYRVKAGLVDQFDMDVPPTAQQFPPLEDLTANAPACVTQDIATLV
jgi:hypothetical protein